MHGTQEAVWWGKRGWTYRLAVSMSLAQKKRCTVREAGPFSIRESLSSTSKYLSPYTRKSSPFSSSHACKMLIRSCSIYIVSRCCRCPATFGSSLLSFLRTFSSCKSRPAACAPRCVNRLGSLLDSSRCRFSAINSICFLTRERAFWRLETRASRRLTSYSCAASEASVNIS